MFKYSLFLFFFKQKTAYEMRISDWSSDVCSSDLLGPDPGQRFRRHHHAAHPRPPHPDPPEHPLLPRTAAGPRRPRRQPGASPATVPRPLPHADRKSVVEGKSVSERLDLGGRRIIKKKNKNNTRMKPLRTHN